MDTFDLRVVAQPSSKVYVTTLQDSEESLRADMDTILEAWMPESEAPSVELAEDTMMAALFVTSEIPPPPPQEYAKRRSGSRGG